MVDFFLVLQSEQTAGQFDSEVVCGSRENLKLFPNFGNMEAKMFLLTLFKISSHLLSRKKDLFFFPLLIIHDLQIFTAVIRYYLQVSFFKKINT